MNLVLIEGCGVLEESDYGCLWWSESDLKNVKGREDGGASRFCRENNEG